MSIYKKDIKCETLKSLGYVDNRDVAGLFGGFNDYYQKRKASLEAEYTELERKSDKDNYTFEKLSIEIELSDLSDSLILCHEVAVLALYKKVEVRSKKLVKTAFPETDEKRLFNFRRISEQLSALGIDVANLPEFETIDELRRVCNAIKHSGIVTDELAEYEGWIVGEPLPDLSEFYSRVEPSVPIYIEGLTLKLEALVGCYVAPSDKFLLTTRSR